MVKVGGMWPNTTVRVGERKNVGEKKREGEVGLLDCCRDC